MAAALQQRPTSVAAGQAFSFWRVAIALWLFSSLPSRLSSSSSFSVDAVRELALACSANIAYRCPALSLLSWLLIWMWILWWASLLLLGEKDGSRCSKSVWLANRAQPIKCPIAQVFYGFDLYFCVNLDDSEHTTMTAVTITTIITTGTSFRQKAVTSKMNEEYMQ